MNEQLLKKIELSIHKFTDWLDEYGETSYDFHTVYANPIGRKAKALYYKKPLIGINSARPSFN